jgi:hypothetical protein
MITNSDSDSINALAWKQKYLARCALWNWHDSHRINIVDIQNRGTITLDSWQTLVFHEADGNKTVEELFFWLVSQYSDKQEIPQNLEEIILTALKQLIEQMKVVELWTQKNDLAYYFELPTDEQDEHETLRFMKEDGLKT